MTKVNKVPIVNFPRDYVGLPEYVIPPNVQNGFVIATNCHPVLVWVWSDWSWTRDLKDAALYAAPEDAHADLARALLECPKNRRDTVRVIPAVRTLYPKKNSTIPKIGVRLQPSP